MRSLNNAHTHVIHTIPGGTRNVLHTTIVRSYLTASVRLISRIKTFEF